MLHLGRSYGVAGLINQSFSVLKMHNVKLMESMPVPNGLNTECSVKIRLKKKLKAAAGQWAKKSEVEKIIGFIFFAIIIDCCISSDGNFYENEPFLWFFSVRLYLSKIHRSLYYDKIDTITKSKLSLYSTRWIKLKFVDNYITYGYFGEISGVIMVYRSPHDWGLSGTPYNYG